MGSGVSCRSSVEAGASGRPEQSPGSWAQGRNLQRWGRTQRRQTEGPSGGNDRHTCLLGQCYLRRKCQSRREPGRRLSASWLPILPVRNSCSVREAARAACPVQGHVHGGGDALRQDLTLSPLVAALPPLAPEALGLGRKSGSWGVTGRPQGMRWVPAAASGARGAVCAPSSAPRAPAPPRRQGAALSSWAESPQLPPRTLCHEPCSRGERGEGAGRAAGM